MSNVGKKSPNNNVLLLADVVFIGSQGISIKTGRLIENWFLTLNDAVPTITCSRSALGALKFWWQMTRNGEKEYAKPVSYILEIAKYQKDRLDKMKYRLVTTGLGQDDRCLPLSRILKKHQVS